MKRILSYIIFAFSFATLQAETRINLGALELDKEYELESFKNYIGTFTAPRTGVLTCSATTNDVMYPYVAELEDMEIETNRYEVSMNNLYGGRSYDFNVEKGKTYVMYASFIMNNGTVFKMTMADHVELNLTSTSPSEGETFNVANGGMVVFNFDKSINYTSATLSIANETSKISGSISTNSLHFDIKNTVWNWLSSGKVNPGDKITILVEGVSLSSDNTVLCNGDGKVSLNLILGEMPITLESTENTSGNFLSYYTSTNEEGLVKLHFSGKVSPDMLNAQLKYGDIDKDAEGDYYVEYIKPNLSEDGKTVIVNLQGKRRKAIDMTSSGTNYEKVFLGITGVLDEKGNYAFASGQGSLGSYWFSYDFKEISASVFCEFTPASGSTLSDKTKSIELWITDEALLSYSGLLFTYTNEGDTKSVVLNSESYTKIQDPDDPTASILTIPVPNEVLTGEEVTLTLLNLECSDGSDYNSLLTATYKTNASSIYSQKAGKQLKIFTVSGQKVQTPSKGVYIINNQKQYIK